MGKFTSKLLNTLGINTNEEDDFEEYEEVSTPQVLEDTSSFKRGKVVNINATTQFRVVVIQPETFDEAKEIADHLKERKPVVIEARNDLVIGGNICLANSSFLRDYIKTNKIPTYLESTCTNITKNTVTVTDKDGKTYEIPADSVIVSIGYTPNPIAQKSKNVHIVGDANKVGNLRTVIWRAWDVCVKL